MHYISFGVLCSIQERLFRAAPDMFGWVINATMWQQNPLKAKRAKGMFASTRFLVERGQSPSGLNQIHTVDLTIMGRDNSLRAFGLAAAMLDRLDFPDWRQSMDHFGNLWLRQLHQAIPCLSNW
jgi:hypothetical protein